MYGLFNYTYDYYEWEELICVSESVEKLQAKYILIKDSIIDGLVESEEAHCDSQKMEINHCYIKKVEIV